MVLIVMGVSGSGKSSVGRGVARRLNWAFLEGDDFHPVENVQKMSRGEPLNDEDRRPWLDALNAAARGMRARGEDVVVACSALKKAYRERLARGFGPGEVRFVYLKAPAEVIEERMKARAGHFMKAGMLESQLRTLEEPGEDESVVVVETGGLGVEEVVGVVVEGMREKL